MTNNHNIKLEHAIIKLGSEYSINGYKAEGNDNFYVDMGDVSKLLGYPEGCLQTVIAEQGKTWNELRKIGYQHTPLKGFVVWEDGSVRFINAITTHHFSLVVTYAAMTGQKEAVVMAEEWMMRTIKQFIQYSIDNKDE